MKLLLKNTISNVGTRLFVILLNLALVPILIQTLGVNHYGLMIFGNNIIGNFMFLDAGLTRGVTRFVAKYSARNEIRNVYKILNNSLSIYLIISLINALVLLIVYVTEFYSIFNISDQDEGIFSKMLLIASVSAFVHWVSKVYTGGLFGLQMYHLNNIAKWVNVLLSPVGIIILAKMGVSVLWIFCYQQATYLAMLMLQGIFMYRKSGWLPGVSINKTVLKEIYGFSAWIFLSKISNQIVLQFDVFLISAYLNPAALVPYNIFSVLYINLAKISDLTLSAIVPYLVSVYEKSGIQELNRYGYKISRFTNVLNTLMIFIAVLYVDPFIRLWVGEEYIAYTWIIELVFLITLAYKANNIVFHLSSSSGRVKEFSFTSMTAAALNIPLTIFFVKIYQGPGALLATVFVYLLSSLAYYVIIFPLLEMKVSRFFKESLLPAVWANTLIFIVFYWLLKEVINSIDRWELLLLSASITGALFLVVSYVFGLGKSEKNMISKYVARYKLSK